MVLFVMTELVLTIVQVMDIVIKDSVLVRLDGQMRKIAQECVNIMVYVD